MTQHSITSTSAYNTKPSDEAVAYAQRIANELASKLHVTSAFYTLSPWRKQGREFLGMDWLDNRGRSFSLTFAVTGEPRLGEAETSVADMTDALLLARLIAEKTLGPGRAQLGSW